MNLSAKPPGRRCRSGKTGNMQPTMPPQAGQAQAGDFSTFCPSYQIEYNLGSINGLFVDIFGLFSGFALVVAFVLACNSKASGMQLLPHLTARLLKQQHINNKELII